MSKRSNFEHFRNAIGSWNDFSCRLASRRARVNAHGRRRIVLVWSGCVASQREGRAKHGPTPPHAPLAACLPSPTLGSCFVQHTKAGSYVQCCGSHFCRHVARASVSGGFSSSSVAIAAAMPSHVSWRNTLHRTLRKLEQPSGLLLYALQGATYNP